MHAVIHRLTGMEHVLPTHQGRAAERISIPIWAAPGQDIHLNTHFDTTRANIEYSGAEALDIPIPEGTQPATIHPFKGNMDTEKLEALLHEKKQRYWSSDP